MQLNTLSDLLKIDKKDVRNYSTDQLRLVLGVARYFTRSIEREINRRETGAAEKDLQFLSLVSKDL